MELRQLAYLVAVADEGGFTRAAARLHVAQPGVSAQVKRLERELGHELLDRSGRAVRPTAAGETVLPHARAALAAVDAVRVAADELTGLVRGRLALGTVAAVDSEAFDLPATLAAFHADHPGVEIALGEGTTADLLAAVRAGRLDAALVGLGGADPPGIARAAVVDEPLVAAVAPGHPLAGRERASVAELRDHALGCLPRGTGMRTALDAACAAAGFAPDIAFEAGSPNQLADLAARGLGVAVLPLGGVLRRAGALRAVRLTNPVLRGRLVLAWRAGGPGSPAGQAFVAHARRTLPDPQAGAEASSAATSEPAS